jgi:hypothetical protein
MTAPNGAAGLAEALRDRLHPLLRQHERLEIVGVDLGAGAGGEDPAEAAHSPLLAECGVGRRLAVDAEHQDAPRVPLDEPHEFGVLHADADEEVQQSAQRQVVGDAAVHQVDPAGPLRVGMAVRLARDLGAPGQFAVRLGPAPGAPSAAAPRRSAPHGSAA